MVSTRTRATTGSTSDRFLFDGVIDGRVAPKERVVTLGGPDGEAISLPWTELRTTGVANIEHEGVPLVVFWAPGTVSALDLPNIDDSEDVGSTGVFGRVVDGQALTFERTEDATRFRDRETGSSWDITGRAVDRTAGWRAPAAHPPRQPLLVRLGRLRA